MAWRQIGDITFVPRDSNLCIGNVSVVKPSARTHCSAAALKDGSAAAVRDPQKPKEYRVYDPDAYVFLPLSHETHSRLGRPATADLN